MTKQPKVSVIVPIYKVEKYLKQCVDSIINQTLKDIEIILVDDGSPDNCGKIIDEYAKQDNRVIALHQKNGGYGKAVNHGINIAKGEYIGIIESDDWIESTMYEKLYKNAKKNDTDITKCAFYQYDSTLPLKKQNKKWYNKYQNLINAPNSVFSVNDYPLIVAFHASIWSNIYKKDFLDKENIRVIETKSASYQDFPFMIECMCKAKRITVVPEYLVHYRMEEGQDSSTMRRDKRLLLMAEMCLVGKNIMTQLNYYNQLKEEFYYHAYLANYNFYNTIYLKYKYEYFKKLRELFKDIKNDKTFKYKYFNKGQRKFVENIVNNRYIIFSSLLKFIRHWIFSIHINKNNSLFQILGIQIRNKSCKLYRPSIITIKY